uniref:Amidase domain-containing protein n=1 Tax=Acrobeloides nanus TaxID=290746 RepID=A0A914EAV7_9BILA
MIRRQELTSVSLIEAYIRRIDEVNFLINAVVIKNFKDALKQAAEVDSYINSLDKKSEEYKKLDIDKPLLGIPFTIKDSFCIKDLVCTVGYAHRKDEISKDDAEVVKRLKNAGAILLAVTNVPEGIMWGETANTLFGRTNNPYDTRRAPGGSSGGEAALISSGGSIFGIGSDFAGSIRGPASFCGIYGFMPSPDIVPLDGSFPLVKTGYRTKMWRVGPLCRYAEDLSLVLKVIAGEKSDTILHLSQPVDIKKLKIFYMEGIRSPYVENPNNDVINVLRKAVHYFEEKYNMLTYRIDFPLIHESTNFWSVSQDDPDYPPFYKEMSGGKYDVDCWKELFLFFLGRSQHTLPAIISGIQSSGASSEIEKNDILYKRDQLKQTLETLLGNYGILIFPTFPTLASFHHYRLFTPPFFSMYCGLWNAINFCAVNCPMGLDKNGLPMHVQIVAPKNLDRLLIKIAEELEKEYGWVL